MPVTAIRIDRSRFERNLLLGYALFYIFAAWCTARLSLAFPAPLLGAASLTHQIWYVFGFKIFGLLLVPAIALRKLRYRFRDIAGPDPWGRSTLFAAAFAYALGLSINLGHVSHIQAAMASDALDLVPVRLGLGIVLPLLYAGIPEEVFFRALLQTRLEASSGRVVAILVSNTLFTAWHIPTRYLLSSGVEGTAGDFASVLLGTGLPVFIAGLVFSLLWDRYRKLVPLIAAHWGVDTLPAISSLMGVLTSNAGR